MPVIVDWCPTLMVIEGESVADRLIRYLRVFDGVSLSNRTNELAQLTGRGVDPPSLCAYTWLTNCATSALGFIAAACATVDTARSVHPLLATESQNGASISWIYQIGGDLRIQSKYAAGTALPRVCLCSFSNGYHVEWKLGDGLHGGGGRPNNAIAVGAGDIVKPNLTDVFDFVALLERLAPSPAVPAGNLDAVLAAEQVKNAAKAPG